MPGGGGFNGGITGSTGPTTGNTGSNTNNGPTTPPIPSYDANKYLLPRTSDYERPRNGLVQDLERRLAEAEAAAGTQSPNFNPQDPATTLNNLSDLLRESKPGIEFIDILLLAQMKRLEVYDSKIQFMINKIEIRNTYMSQLNQLIQTARDGRPNKSNEKEKMPSDVIHFMSRQGLDVPGFQEELSPEKYDQYVLSLKGLLDDENNEAQLDMTRMQRQINYRNQVYDTMVSYLSKVLKSRETIIANSK